MFKKRGSKNQHLQPKESRPLKGIKARIIKLKKAMFGQNLVLAKKLYINIMRKYLKLRPRDQRSVHSKILKLYNQRKRAEELFKKKREGELKNRPKPLTTSQIIRKYKYWLIALGIMLFIWLPSMYLLVSSITSDVVSEFDMDDWIFFITSLVLVMVFFMAVAIVTFRKAREVFVKSLAKYAVQKLIPVFFLMLGGFTFIFVLLYLVLTRSSGGEVSSLVGGHLFGYILMGITLVTLILFVIFAPRLLTKDLSNYTLEIKNNYVKLKKIKKFLSDSDSPLKELQIKGIKMDGFLKSLFTSEEKFKEYDTVLKGIMHVRDLLAREKVDLAKAEYETLKQISYILDEEKRELIGYICADLEKEIASADYIFKKG